MTPSETIVFPPFRLDPTEERLWRGKQRLPLQRRPFSFLSYLLRYPGKLITKDELIATVWEGSEVEDETLKVCVQKVRLALGDNAQTPRFVETVHGRGYRFIGKVVNSQYSVDSRQEETRSRRQKMSPSPLQVSNRKSQTPMLVGRNEELAALQSFLEKAQTGQRQVVFISGEAGIGKSTLLKSFIAQLTGCPNILVAFGHCTEHHGSGEPYQPVMDALTRLCHQPHRQLLISQMRAYAPLWLAQMPEFLNPKQRATLLREIQGASRERMQREFANFVEALTADSTDHQSPVLVLCLEDLHWSDPSTIDLLVTLARRPEPARLLLIATYRPVEVFTKNHPLHTVRPELLALQHCIELCLSGLTETAVEAYLSQRFTGERQSLALVQELAHVLFNRTEGNPFLLVTLIEDLIARGIIVHNGTSWTFPVHFSAIAVEIPTSLRHFIEKHLDLLAPEEQQLLLTASVTSGDFSAELIATSVNTTEVEAVDQQCATLARRQQFLQPVGIDVRHNRRKFDRYTFRHALTREVCFDRLTVAQQRQLNRRIGAWKENVYGPRAKSVAAELAMHFDRGHDPQRAIHYYQQAAENAVRRFASQEAVAHLQRALMLLQELPDTPTHAEQELGLQFQLRVQLGRLKGEASPQLEPVVQRIESLSRQVELTPQLFWAFTGVYLFYLIREELQTARNLAQQRIQLAQRFSSPLFAMAAHTESGIASFFLGHLTDAYSQFEQAIARYDPHESHPFFFDWEHGPPCYCYAAFVAWQLGNANQAQQLINQALSRSRTLRLPYMEAFTLNCAALLAVLCGQMDLVHERTTAAIDIATAHGFLRMVEMAKIYHGWALVHNGSEEEVLQQIQQSMNAYQIGGGDSFRTAHLALYADACGKLDLVTEGLAAVNEALSLAQRTGGRYYEAELYRIKGTLVLESKVQSLESIIPAPSSKAAADREAERCFLKAIEIAQKQQAKSWELRAAMGLVRLWQQQAAQNVSCDMQSITRAKLDKARAMLSNIYNWFTEGFDTKDLREAKALLNELQQ